MAEHRIGLLVSLFLLEVLLLDAAKILTVSTLSGSHYIMMHRLSHVLQDHGHNVTNLLNEMVFIPAFKEEKIYRVINWRLPEDQQKEIDKRIQLTVEELVAYGRFKHHTIAKLYETFADLCSHLLSRKDILDSLRNENFDLDLEDFIIKFRDSGFVLVALGSIATIYQTKELIKEMNSAFAHLPQGVLWACKDAHWPKDVRMAPNVKIMDWLPQTDLLAHPSIRLFVNHGGINSIMEAIQHGVPMVGIPFFGDQVENMVRIEAKKIGVSVQLETLKAETFARTLKEVIEDKRFKSAAMAARAIRRSHPLTPSQRLVGWIDHILQTGGGAHLKPHGFQQPWHVQNLLDVLLFLLGLTQGTLWLLKKMLGLLLRSQGMVRKEKKS
ncbi:UDP-glucuronosyltransferase 3A1 isoform X2 [Peromyscus maniculatus bairdii]|uniref:UDP-glucuronosyltransferase 3A1 isoform X2 n=1 Tax=Peromyscus maniculatus bairdii TaxID=230844 RepID=UPI003FD582DC